MRFSEVKTQTFLLVLLLVISTKGESDGDEKSSENTNNDKVEIGFDEVGDKDVNGAPSIEENGDKKVAQTPLHKYKYLFSQHRSTQLEAVKRIVSYDDNTRRYTLVNMILKQLFKTVEEAKTNVTIWGYLPGDSFPENVTILEGVTKIIENTALFGDMVLRLPDIVHSVYDNEKKWQVLLAWAYGFCTQSQVFEGPNLQLLELMAQEVNIIPQDPKYFNPFKAANQEKVKEKNDPIGKPEKKKPKKKRQRGPRMSHTEL